LVFIIETADVNQEGPTAAEELGEAEASGTAVASVAPDVLVS